MQDDIKKNLTLAQNVVYTCQNSGACCRNDWLIGIDTKSYARLKDVDWSKYDSDLADRDKFKVLKSALPTGELITFNRTSCGECVFLTKDSKCGIHNHLGFNEKPQVCKEFPYYFMETPDGISVGLSFACTAVRSHKGKTLSQQKNEILDILGNSYRVKKLPETISLFSGIEISWNEYKLLEEGLLNILSQNTYSFPLALMSGSLLTSIGISLKQVEEQALKENIKPQETFQGGLLKLKQDNYKRIFTIAANMKYPVRANLSYLAPLYTWLQFSKKKINRFALTMALYTNYYKFYKGRGRLPDLISGQGTVNVAEIQKIRFMTQNPQIDAFLREYWSHVIFRKNLTPVHGVFRGYHTMLVLYALMKWFSKMMAFQQGRSQVNLEDIQNSVREVEQRFVLHSQFPQIFSMSQILTLMIDRAYVQASFLPSVVMEQP